MTSYSQFLPQGALGTSSMPFFMPQFHGNRGDFFYVAGNGVLIFSDDVANKLEQSNTTAQQYHYGSRFAKRTTSSTMTQTGAGILTHIVTPYSNTNQTVTYDVTVDGEATYRFKFNMGVNEVGVIGAAQVGIRDSTPVYPAGVSEVNLADASASSNNDVVLYSPQVAPINGVGIPFTSSIQVTQSAFSAYSGNASQQLMMGLYFGEREVL